MRSQISIMSLVAICVPAGLASASTYTLNFEESDLAGQTVGDYFASSGISFEGALFNAIDYGGYPVVDPVVRNLRGMWGSDVDTEAVSTGNGLSSATIGFEAVGGNVMTSLNFMVARIISQDITVIAREAGTGQLFTHTFLASGSGINANRTVEEFAVDLDALFGTGLTGKQWVEVAIHNHGGMFGLDNVNYQASIPVVPGAGALAGLIGLAGLRGRRR
jgi:hypothetical protein